MLPIEPYLSRFPQSYLSLAEINRNNSPSQMASILQLGSKSISNPNAVAQSPKQNSAREGPKVSRPKANEFRLNSRE
jgi:hypothetical protein